MFLLKPSVGRVTGPFTPNHLALDFGWGNGKTVRAAAVGVVRLAQHEGYGLRIFIDHSEDVVTEYSHLAGRHVRDGQRVEAGEIIATMGDSGSYPDGVHLHFAVWFRGVRVNPASFFELPTPVASPPLEQDAAAFRKKVLAWLG